MEQTQTLKLPQKNLIISFMKKRSFVLIVAAAFCIFSCKEQDEPKFLYVKNSSSFDVAIKDSDSGKDYKINSGYSEIIYTQADIEYSLKQKLEFELNGEKKTVEAEILSEKSYKGLKDGNYCNILELNDIAEYKPSSTFEYTIKNKTEEQIIALCKLFDTEFQVEVDDEKTLAFNFVNPALYFFEKPDYDTFVKNADILKKEITDETEYKTEYQNMLNEMSIAPVTSSSTEKDDSLGKITYKTSISLF